jgi:hypothetical protein
MRSAPGRLLRRSAGALAVAVLAFLAAAPPEGTASVETGLRLAAAPSDPAAGLTVTTVPAVAGFPVTLDGVTALTDAAGKAHFDAQETEEPLTDRVTLTEATLPIGGQQVRVRADRVYPSSTVPLLAVDLSYLVSFAFVGAHGETVDPATIEGMTVKSEMGEVVEVHPGEPTWLQGDRVIKRTAEMEVKKLRWSVQRVQFAGSNVVNASQQFFLPAEQQAVDVHLLFFELHLRVHDALFGFTQTGVIELVYPDGKIRTFGLDRDARLSVPALPRGDYTLTIIGQGPRMSRPLAVSRDQSVDLALYSWVDVLTIVAALLTLALGLAGAGRLRRRRRTAAVRRRSRRRVIPRRSRRRSEPASESPVADVVAHVGRARGELAG